MLWCLVEKYNQKMSRNTYHETFSFRDVRQNQNSFPSVLPRRKGAISFAHDTQPTAEFSRERIVMDLHKRWTPLHAVFLRCLEYWSWNSCEGSRPALSLSASSSQTLLYLDDCGSICACDTYGTCERWAPTACTGTNQSNAIIAAA